MPIWRAFILSVSWPLPQAGVRDNRTRIKRERPDLFLNEEVRPFGSFLRKSDAGNPDGGRAGNLVTIEQTLGCSSFDAKNFPRELAWIVSGGL